MADKKKPKKQKVQVASDSCRRLVKAIMNGWTFKTVEYKPPPQECTLIVVPPAKSSEQSFSGQYQTAEDWLGALMDQACIPKTDEFPEQAYAI